MGLDCSSQTSNSGKPRRKTQNFKEHSGNKIGIFKVIFSDNFQIIIEKKKKNTENMAQISTLNLCSLTIRN